MSRICHVTFHVRGVASSELHMDIMAMNVIGRAGMPLADALSICKERGYEALVRCRATGQRLGGIDCDGTYREAGL